MEGNGILTAFDVVCDGVGDGHGHTTNAILSESGLGLMDLMNLFLIIRSFANATGWVVQSGSLSEWWGASDHVLCQKSL